jgi:hypothetical protein
MNRGGEGDGSYLRFFAMIGTSVFVMFILMYLNSYHILDHAWFSETRLFMTGMMGGSMVVIMFLFMKRMYGKKYLNRAIMIGGPFILFLSLWLVRSQSTVDGIDYMKGMIPHHSIAILTSERAGIDDLRVRALADEIIQAQRREIREMEWLISDIKENGSAETEGEVRSRPVPDFSNQPRSR